MTNKDDDLFEENPPSTRAPEVTPRPTPSPMPEPPTDPAPAPESELPEPLPVRPDAELPDPIPAPEDAPTIEEHAEVLGTAPAILAAMKAAHRLGEGRRMSREHYAAAVARVENIKFQ